jgi:hypothetical protein
MAEPAEASKVEPKAAPTPSVAPHVAPEPKAAVSVKKPGSVSVDLSIDSIIDNWVKELKMALLDPSKKTVRGVWDRFKNWMSNMWHGRYSDSNPYYYQNKFGDHLGATVEYVQARRPTLMEYRSITGKLNEIESLIFEDFTATGVPQGAENLRLVRIIDQKAQELKQLVNGLVQKASSEGDSPLAPPSAPASPPEAARAEPPKIDKTIMPKLDTAFVALDALKSRGVIDDKKHLELKTKIESGDPAVMQPAIDELHTLLRSEKGPAEAKPSRTERWRRSHEPRKAPSEEERTRAAAEAGAPEAAAPAAEKKEEPTVDTSRPRVVDMPEPPPTVRHTPDNALSEPSHRVADMDAAEPQGDDKPSVPKPRSVKERRAELSARIEALANDDAKRQHRKNLSRALTPAALDDVEKDLAKAEWINKHAREVQEFEWTLTDVAQQYKRRLREGKIHSTHTVVIDRAKLASLPLAERASYLKGWEQLNRNLGKSTETCR